MAALLGGLLLGTFLGQWAGLITATFIAIVFFWLWSPQRLDKPPRPFSKLEMDKLTVFLRENLNYIEQKEINFCDDYDPTFSSKLRTAFANADWGIGILGSPYRLKDHKGVWIFGPYQKDLQVAFESINIAVSLGDADGENVIFCGD